MNNGNTKNTNLSEQHPIYRIAMGIEYDGTNYHGWQTQSALLPANFRTAQDTLEEAIAKIACHPIRVNCAGRTDIGVHAFGQVVNFDTTQTRRLDAWICGTNHFLPEDVRIQWARVVPPTFHARFSATARSYKYVIYNHPTPSAILRHRALWYRHPLDEQKMQEAANHLVGEHDFSSFRAASCQSRSTLRLIHTIKITRRDKYFITIDIKANAFLHHMVRNIIGSLLPIGRGEKAPHTMGELLRARNRKLCGITVEAAGLYLMEVEYPPEAFIHIETAYQK
jgi:tRNA pseudouridine38-40 synthase